MIRYYPKPRGNGIDLSLLFRLHRPRRSVHPLVYSITRYHSQIKHRSGCCIIHTVTIIQFPRLQISYGLLKTHFLCKFSSNEIFFANLYISGNLISVTDNFIFLFRKDIFLDRDILHNREITTQSSSYFSRCHNFFSLLHRYV